MTYFLIAFCLLFLITFSVVAIYNKLIKLRNLVTESWSQIDVQLQRRHDLIPNLVNTVKGYAAHERETLKAVVDARNVALSASTPNRIATAEDTLEHAVGRLIVVAEGYPDLKASANFLQLQRDLTDTEDRIAAARRIYNANVRAFNTATQTLPSNIVASRMKLVTAEYFASAEGVSVAPVLS